MGKVITSEGSTIYQSYTTEEGIQQIAQALGALTYKIDFLEDGEVKFSGVPTVTYGGTVVDSDTVILTVALTAPIAAVIDEIRIYIGSNTDHAVYTSILGGAISLAAGGAFTFVDRLNVFPYDADMAKVEIG